MNMNRWIRRTAPLAAIAIASAAPLAAAQSRLIGLPGSYGNYGYQQNGTELFEWTGRVDREVQVVMRNGNVWTNNIGQTENPRARLRAFTALPNMDGQVVVQVMNGRGNVDVIQQPSRQNNYTTIVRITDPQSGADTYRLAAYWQGYANGDVYSRNPNARSGNGAMRRRDGDDDDDRGRGRGDRDDRRDRDDRDNRNGGVPGQTPGQYGQYGQYGSQEVLHWAGNVDDQLEIRIQNGRVDYRTISGNQPTNIRASLGNVDMSRGGSVAVVQNQGRGQVYVAQQPSQWNGYTTVLRVRDPQGGYGYYDFTLIRQ